MKYFDPERFTFYDDAIHASIPAGSVAISDEEHLAAVEAMNSGKTAQVVDGAFVFTDVRETLVDVKTRKLQEIEAAFQAAESAPVSVNGWQFKGGFTSGLAIDAQRRAAEMYRQLNPQAPDTATFFDVHGTPVTVPLLSDAEVDAADICLSISYVVSLNTFKYEQLRNAAWAAITAEEVAAISWGD